MDVLDQGGLQRNSGCESFSGIGLRKSVELWLPARLRTCVLTSSPNITDHKTREIYEATVFQVSYIRQCKTMFPKRRKLHEWAPRLPGSLPQDHLSIQSKSWILKKHRGRSKTRKPKLGLSRSKVAEICGVRLKSARRKLRRERGPHSSWGGGSFQWVRAWGLGGTCAGWNFAQASPRVTVPNRRAKQRWRKSSAGSAGVQVLLG